MGGDDIEVERRQTAYRGYRRIDRYRLRHRRHDGGCSRAIGRELVDISQR